MKISEEYKYFKFSKMSYKNIIIYLAVIVSLITIGFLGYYFGFLGAIYNVIMPEKLGVFPLVILSIIFGIAAFFSPCAFTVLPAYVSHFLSISEKKSGSRFWKLAYLGIIGAAGIIIVNMVVGVIIAFLGAATPFAKDPRQDIFLIRGVRIAAGLFIAFLGIFTLRKGGFNILWFHRLMDEKKSIFLYGVLYNGAAIGCTGPIMLGLLIYAFASASFTGAITAFLVFSLTMGFLMILLTLIAGFFKNSIPNLAVITPKIQKIAAIIMIIVGILIAFLTLEGNRIFVKWFFPFLPS